MKRLEFSIEVEILSLLCFLPVGYDMTAPEILGGTEGDSPVRLPKSVPAD